MSDRDNDQPEQWFLNEYYCSDCGEAWEDEWDCMCNDRCPQCNAENQPIHSRDISHVLKKSG